MFRDLVDRLAGGRVHGPGAGPVRWSRAGHHRGGRIIPAERAGRGGERRAAGRPLRGRAGPPAGAAGSRGIARPCSGISFGGVYARWLAKTRPEIAVWSPTTEAAGIRRSTDPRDSPAAWLSHWAANDEFEEAPAEPAEAANPQSASHSYPDNQALVRRAGSTGIRGGGQRARLCAHRGVPAIGPRLSEPMEIDYPTVDTPRLRLRPFREDDVAALHRADAGS